MIGKRHNTLAIWNCKGTTGTEIILEINHQQHFNHGGRRTAFALGLAGLVTTAQCNRAKRKSSASWNQNLELRMRRFASLALMSGCMALVGCSVSRTGVPNSTVVKGPIRIEIDLNDPSKSFGVLPIGDHPTIFKVGFGRYGVTCAGTRFEEGYTPLGRFKVNAILSNNQFVMEPALIKQSGKSKQELKKILFKNMNAIDFSGDGRTGEYGVGYVSLAPVDSVPQPFAFNEYDGRFRWYSFAIHGSNDDRRIGEPVTGGCLNVTEPVLKQLLSSVKLGDEVMVSANGPCTR